MPGAQFNIWFGISAPKGTPAKQLRKLNEMVKAVVADPEFVQSQVAAGASIVKDERLNPAAHRSFVEAQINHWTGVIRTAESKGDAKVAMK